MTLLRQGYVGQARGWRGCCWRRGTADYADCRRLPRAGSGGWGKGGVLLFVAKSARGGPPWRGSGEGPGGDEGVDLVHEADGLAEGDDGVLCGWGGTAGTTKTGRHEADRGTAVHRKDAEGAKGQEARRRRRSRLLRYEPIGKVCCRLAFTPLLLRRARCSATASRPRQASVECSSGCRSNR